MGSWKISKAPTAGEDIVARDRVHMIAQSGFLVLPRDGALLFDIDGTLADTDPLHAKAWQLIVEANFSRTFTWGEYHDACIIQGLSPVDFLMQLGIDVSSKEMQAQKRDIFRRLIGSELSLAPGVKEFIEEIAEHKIPIAIVSGGSRASVDAFLETLWTGPEPKISVSREDTVQHKPDPEPYNFALARLDRRPADCIAIEDTERGIQSARRAGLQSVLIQGENLSPSTSADLIVENLSRLVLTSDERGRLLIRKKTASAR